MRLSSVISLLASLCLLACRAHTPEKVESSEGLRPLPVELEQKATQAVESRLPVPTPSVVIAGGTVMTGDGKRFAPGYVVISAGKITQVGEGTAPAVPDAISIDATGRFVTPGLIDSHSHLGVYPSPSTAAHNDGNEATDPITAGVWAEHSFWPEDPGLERAVAGGVTAAGILPGSANVIGGRGVVLSFKPHRGSRAMRLPGAPEIIKMACGENPKRVYGSQRRTPSTRMANLRSLRDAYFKAQKYQRDWDRYLKKLEKGAKSDQEARHSSAPAGGKGGKDEPTPPDRDPGLETLALVLSGKALVQWHCYTADDMLSALQVADEFGFRVRSFHHAVEAYKIRDILANKDVSVSTWADWYGFKVEAWDAIPENIALLHAQGVRAIVHSDSAIGIQMLNVEAGKALSSGRAMGLTLSDDDALRWITLNPAWALGIQDLAGSLTPGKRGDVVIWTGSPFQIRSRAERVLIEGEEIYNMNQATAPWSDFELGYSESVRPVPLEVKK